MVKLSTMHDIKIQLKIPRGSNASPAGVLGKRGFIIFYVGTNWDFYDFFIRISLWPRTIIWNRRGKNCLKELHRSIRFDSVKYKTLNNYINYVNISTLKFFLVYFEFIIWKKVTIVYIHVAFTDKIWKHVCINY